MLIYSQAVLGPTHCFAHFFQRGLTDKCFVIFFLPSLLGSPGWFMLCIFILLGRVHSAKISGLNMETRSVMVEWFENGEAKGKEVSLILR